MVGQFGTSHPLCTYHSTCFPLRNSQNLPLSIMSNRKKDLPSFQITSSRRLVWGIYRFGGCGFDGCFHHGENLLVMQVLSYQRMGYLLWQNLWSDYIFAVSPFAACGSATEIKSARYRFLFCCRPRRTRRSSPITTFTFSFAFPFPPLSPLVWGFTFGSANTGATGSFFRGAAGAWQVWYYQFRLLQEGICILMVVVFASRFFSSRLNLICLLIISMRYLYVFSK